MVTQIGASAGLSMKDLQQALITRLFQAKQNTSSEQKPASTKKQQLTPEQVQAMTRAKIATSMMGAMQTLSATGYGKPLETVLQDLGGVANRVNAFGSQQQAVNNPFSTFNGAGAPTASYNPASFAQRMLYELQIMPLKYNTPGWAIDSVLKDLGAFTQGYASSGSVYNPFSQGNLQSGFQLPGSTFMGLGAPYYYPQVGGLQSPGSLFNLTPAALTTLMA